MPDSLVITPNVSDQASLGDIIELAVAPGGTWQKNDLTAITGAPPAASASGVADTLFAYVAPDGSGRVVYRDGDIDRTGDVIELWLAPGAGTWQWDSLTAITGAPPAVGHPVAYVTPGHVARVVYPDGNAGITELWLAPGAGTWQQDSLTAITGAPAAASTPVAYVTPDNVARVVYTDSNSGITELSLVPGGTWQQASLTAITGAPLATISAPFVYVTPDNVVRVVYQSFPAFVPPPPGQPAPPSRADIIELRLEPGAGTWQQVNLTAIAGAAQPSGAPVAYVTPDNVARVVYPDGNSGITELRLEPGAGTWQQDSLTAITGAPQPFGHLFAYVAPDGSGRIVYRDGNGDVIELWLAPGGTWQWDSLTAITGAPPAAGAPFAYVTPDKVARIYYSSQPS